MTSSSAATISLAASRAVETADFDRLLEDFRSRVDREIAAFLAAKRRVGAAAPGAPALGEPADLVEGVRALLAVGGKRLRPALVYFTYRACGGTADDQVLPLALATELLHTYLLIHDDIMDHAETRRGQPAAHVRFAGLHSAAGLRGDAQDFGRSVALLLGDLAHTYAAELFAAAVQLGAGSPSIALAELTRCFAEMCEEVIGGQYLEFLLAHRATAEAGSAAVQPLADAAKPPAGAAPQLAGAVREAELLRILRLKSGRYTAERPIQLGALLAGAPAPALGDLSRYGTAVGEAFQLQDDLLGVFGDPMVTGKPVGDDLREGKYTLLVHHALLVLPAGPGGDRDFLVAALGNADLDPADVARAQAILEHTGARRAVSAMIAERLAAARAALDALASRGFTAAPSAADAATAPSTPAPASGAAAPAAAHGTSAPSAAPSAADGFVFLAGLLDYLRERQQ